MRTPAEGNPTTSPKSWIPAGRIAVALQLALACLAAWSQNEAAITPFQDPEKTLTTEFSKTPCRECHAAEYEVWKETVHATSFNTMHRSSTAREIAEKMGYRLIKRESLCLECHYTAIVLDDQLRAVSGVSCESCHGAGRGYVNVHNDYGGKGVTAQTETPEHRAQRIERSRAGGMRRPSDLYDLAATCYQCHFVPDEELVNVGGHGTGSRNFELLAWSQGNMRHNFLQSFLTGDGTENAERQPPRKRVMFVTGKALALEYSLRAMAVASEEGRYAKTKERTVTNAIRDLSKIERKIVLPQIEAMLETVRSINIIPNNRVALMGAADRIGQLTREFLAEHDGIKLAAIDPLFLEPESNEDLADGDAGPDGTSTAAATATGTADTGGVGTGGSDTGVYAVIGPGRCLSCHTPQEEWWIDDPHYRSADPFLFDEPLNAEIAANYGISEDEMKRGDHRCMSCHGTAVSGRESREVNDGVGCEACHGPGDAYLKPHQEGDKALGDQRPGYLKGLALGLADLRRTEVRAEACVSCHYINDPKLLRAGHPDGTDFDYRAGMAKVKHWNRPPMPEGALETAVNGVLSRKGPIPDVPRATLKSRSGDVPAETERVEGQAAVPAPSAESGTAQQAAAPTATSNLTSAALKTRIRPLSEFDTLGPDRCVSCHEKQETWWARDPHAHSVDPFFEEREKNIAIATKYGLSVEDMARGNQLCMDCHATVVTGRERRQVTYGVGCEDCHGPGKSYLKPHQEGDKSLGLQRPGYLKSLDLGLVALKDLETRTKACVECHYIKEPRLISSGHPTGKDFDFVAGMKRVRHWSAELEAEDDLRRVYGAVTGLATPVRKTASKSAATTTTEEPAEPKAEETGSSLGLPDFPEIDPSMSIEEIMLILKERLTLLHRALPAGKGDQD